MDKKFADQAYELSRDAHALFLKTLNLRIEVGVSLGLDGEYDASPDSDFSLLERAEDNLYDAYSYLLTSSAL